MLRDIVILATALTIGALVVEIHNSREIAQLRVDKIGAYWDGYNEGYNTGKVELRIEEDDPRWDCKTMGNKKCGR